jgi:hypothetical protein
VFDVGIQRKTVQTKKAHLSVSLFDTAYGAAPDERFLAVRAGDSEDWILVDFFAYLKR